MKQFVFFRLDFANQCLWRLDAVIPLPPKPFAVLRYLVENAGRLITHDELLDALWPETYVQPQVLRTYILDLRKALDDDAANPRFIQTLPKRGYRFLARVEDSDDPQTNENQKQIYEISNGHSHLKTGVLQPDPRDDQNSIISDTVQAPKFINRAAKAPKISVGQTEISTSPSPENAISHSRPYLCRETELALLTERVLALSAGQRMAVFITGEAGIGKTALIDSFCRQDMFLGEPGRTPFADIARGQCVEGFAGKEQYYPVMEALGQLCAASRDSRACQILARIAPGWLTGVGRPHNPGPLDTSQPSSFPTNQAPLPSDLCAAIEELSSDKPLILIFEDLQWADDSTLHLISALARRRAPSNLMLIGTYRPKEVAAKHPLRTLKQDLLMRQLCIEISLGPLPRMTVKQMLSAELGQSALPDGLNDFVYQHSEGNPLFAIAILEHLIAQKFLVKEEANGVMAWEQSAPFQEMEAGVPSGLAQMIELEIEALDTHEQQMLEAGSLMPVAFPAWAVAAALNKDPSEIEETCDSLARRLHFVERAGHDELPDGTSSAFYVFSHGLYREALYERQVATRRAQRHIRIAEKMGESFSGRESDVAREMAIHFEAAGDWQRAAAALRNAAGYALSRNANAEAVQLLEHALRVSQNFKQPADRKQASADLNHQLEQAREAAADQGLAIPSLCMKA